VTSCFAWKLYVILDRDAAEDRDLADLAAAAIRGGADALQLRDKTGSARRVMAQAARLLAITRPAGIPLIINDRADLARAAGADGVHLGQDDLPVAEARAILGAGRLIGKSSHSLDQAMAAGAEGPDYVGFGPVFPTPTKPDYGSVGLDLISRVISAVRVPVVCIGGIDLATLPQVLASGAERVAVVRAVCKTADPEAATRALKHQLTQFPRASPTRI